MTTEAAPVTPPETPGRVVEHTAALPAARTAVDRLALEQIQTWQPRHARALELARVNKGWFGDNMTRDVLTGVVDGWAVIYLLLLLREVDPGTADHAAAYLHATAGDAVDLPGVLDDWASALVEGRPVAPLLP